MYPWANDHCVNRNAVVVESACLWAIIACRYIRAKLDEAYAFRTKILKGYLPRNQIEDNAPLIAEATWKLVTLAFQSNSIVILTHHYENVNRYSQLESNSGRSIYSPR